LALRRRGLGYGVAWPEVLPEAFAFAPVRDAVPLAQTSDADSRRATAGFDASAPKCRLLVVKVASRCNLNCSYCYVYNAGDRSYLKQPLVMSDATIDILVKRVAAHCRRHRLGVFTFVFHGGEPLMAGQRFFRHFAARVSAEFPPEIKARLRLQSNGMLLTKDWCELLKELKIGLGISLDGPRWINDLHRVNHAGKGSYDRVKAGWDTARSCGLHPGLLTVVNVDADPLEIYHHAKELGARSLDFLLPDCTHDTPPPRYSGSAEATPYADWLLRIFMVWVAERKPPFRIRLFEHLMRAILGANDSFDNFNSDPNEVMVIESNGDIESLDVLKICRDGITQSAANIHRHELDEAFDNEMIRLYYNSGKSLCATCENCLVRSVCAGGYLPHRYRRDNAFDNPSVYCRDLMKLITGIQNWIAASLPASVLADTGLTRITYAEARRHVLAFQHSPILRPFDARAG
jgi:uncharacterized protein